jgi:hypothetical protein
MGKHNVLHGYYPLGGRAFSEVLTVTEERINNRVPPVHISQKETILNPNNGPQMFVTATRTVKVPSFRHLDIDSIKLPLVYVTGKSSTINYLSALLVSPNRRQGGHSTQTKNLPWSGKNFIEYVKTSYDVSSLVFNGLSYSYTGLNSADQPTGSVRAEMDESAETNQPFFNAQQTVLRGLRTLVGSRAHIETPRSTEVGRLDIRAIQVGARILTQTLADLSDALREEPVVAQADAFTVKQKIQF